MTTYAVTGATGGLGRRAVQELLDRGVPASDVVAVVRRPDAAADLAARGVQVRHGDYSRPDTLPAALAGVDRLLLVSGSEAGQRVPQHTAVIDAAAAGGVQRIVYTSIAHADTSTNPLAPEHRETEEVLRRSGVPATVLRNSWYAEGYTSRIDEYLATGEIVGAAGDGRVSVAPRDDFAVAAAAALLADEEGTVVRELGGPGVTLADLAAAVTEVTGTTVRYRDLPAGELVATLQGGGLDAGTAGFVAGIDTSIARGDLDTGDADLAALLGRPVTPLADAVRAARG
ncbi:SDR family oxidoreductase [Geodermatophilus aquaeductus]|uniref:NAD(P)H dehydrogenase (Quinone) n=1 Tax=Geodermatophilus aquaeductus TaxID=1564161 RepID=A0A521C7Z4_9ACTN|nr:SDR family oxidoreductase [Geodermatophilus aquaeductus]SMO55602.1 NAD(P)H dehydrogenase (quinone) [Geodermatophilus aquaeductus]